MMAAAFCLLATVAAQDGQQGSLPGVGEALSKEELDPALKDWIKDVNNSDLWWVGAFLSILGSLLSIMGLNLQRYSHRLEAAKPLAMRTRSYRQTPWIGEPRSAVMSRHCPIARFSHTTLRTVQWALHW